MDLLLTRQDLVLSQRFQSIQPGSDLQVLDLTHFSHVLKSASGLFGVGELAAEGQEHQATQSKPRT